MKQKLVVMLGGIFLSTALSAHELTSPFYMPEMGHILSKTAGNYQKDKFKNFTTSKRYLRQIGQELDIGLGAGFTAHLAGALNWDKQKEIGASSSLNAKAYRGGIAWQNTHEKWLTRLAINYQQTTALSFLPRRSLDTHLYLGQSLKTMTPYLHVNALLPLNARDDFNNPIYNAQTGVFQNINSKLTLNSALSLKYDKNIKGRSYGIYSELSYLIMPNLAISLNASWDIYGRAKNNARTYHQAVGTNIRFSF